MKATDIENVDSVEFKNLMTPELLKLGKVFNQNNYDIRLVGGAVRDLMLGKYQTLLSEARSINGQEGTADVIESNEWIDSRTRYTSGWFKPFSSTTASGVS